MNYFDKVPKEIVLEIINYLSINSKGRLKCVDKRFNQLVDFKDVSKVEMKRRKRISKLRKFNPSLYLIEKYPELKWNWKGFSKSLNFTWDIYLKYPDKDWDRFELSCHPN